MDELTPRQTEILNLIREHLRDHGLPPTRAEIARSCGFRSANAAEEQLRSLARKGYIDISPGRSRGIRLLGGNAEGQEGLPLIGRVAAGSPILAEQHIEGHYRFDAALFQPRADYLLRVQGLSMRDAGILDGDLLAVHRTTEVRDGQIVVARLDDEVTVKRLECRGGKKHQLRLLPDNPDFAPIEVDLRRQPFAIEGLGVGIIRQGSPL